jgi:hypothetical protein
VSIRNRYYLPEPTAGLLSRLGRRLTGRPVPAFPKTVQLQTVTGCNADCVFCPYGSAQPQQPHGRMRDDLFRAIVDECARHRVRRISPYLMNEPFLDPQLPERIRFIKKRLPASKVVLTTNGSLLRPGMIDRLLGIDPGLDALYVSVQGVNPEVYRKTMRGALHLPVVLEHIDDMLRRVGRKGRPKIWITMVRTARLDVGAALQYWRRRGVRCTFTGLDNRGGHIVGSGAAPAGDLEPNTTCARLFKQAYILFNGDMVLCCADWRRQVVLGNVDGGSIAAVWNGDKAIRIRRAYMDRRFSDLDLCRDCKIDRVRGRIRSSLPRKVPARYNTTVTGRLSSRQVVRGK